MSEWKLYQRKGEIELREYSISLSLSGVSISDGDNPWQDAHEGRPGFIARNPRKRADMWYVNREYAEKNYELIEEFGGE
jgi:hypothetical protein